MNERKRKNSSKVNFTVSAVFHTVLICGVTFLAAREGMLGNKLKTLAVTMVPKEKPKAEPVKEKPPEAKVEAPKVAQEKRPEAAAPKVETAVAAPPPACAGGPVAAPEAVNVAAFAFEDGAKEVITDPNAVYKQTVEHALRSRWNRPEDLEDEKFVAQAELDVDAAGKVQAYRWVSGSGNNRWDDSVKAALASTKTIGQRPPKGFPQKFTVRFDVETQAAEEVMQLSIR